MLWSRAILLWMRASLSCRGSRPPPGAEPPLLPCKRTAQHRPRASHESTFQPCAPPGNIPTLKFCTFEFYPKVPKTRPSRRFAPISSYPPPHSTTHSTHCPPIPSTPPLPPSPILRPTLTGRPTNPARRNPQILLKEAVTCVYPFTDDIPLARFL